MQRTHAFVAAMLLAVTALLPATAKDLPFAPPRKPKTEQAQSPLAFSPFEHEAVVATLLPGWTLAEQINDRHIVVMQFRPPGSQGIPTEFINVATYVGDRRTGLEFMDHIKKGMLKMAPKGKAEIEVVNATNPNDVMFDYSIKGWIEAPDQFEMQRVIKGQDGVHSIIYHIANPDATDADRNKMQAWLKTVKVVSKEQYLGMQEAGKTTGSQATPAASPNSAAPAAK